MFFEGAEKKVEIILSNENLFNLERFFWESIVQKCEATILSSIENDTVKAYLLSESSLFVWRDRLLMLTCGETKLVNSVLALVEKFGESAISCLIYQRKNEYRSHLQSTHFEEDVKAIHSFINGDALRFGKLHGHHNLLFSSNKEVNCEDDATVELLMYDMAKEVSDHLTTPGLSKEHIRDYLAVTKVFPDFEIDDFSFDPYGYSLNAIKDHLYFTIHVTPQETSPYVSFETNMKTYGQERLLTHFLEILKPDSFDIMSFNQVTSFTEGGDYLLTCHQADRLMSGYHVEFKSFQLAKQLCQKPFKIG